MPPVEFVPLLGVRFIAGTRDTHDTHVRDKQSHVKHIARWFAHLRICRIRTIDVTATGYFNSNTTGGMKLPLQNDSNAMESSPENVDAKESMNLTFQGSSPNIG